MKLLLTLIIVTALPAFGQRRGSDNLEVHLDQPYAGTDNPRQKLDLYLPKNRSGNKPLPVVAFIHGGGWRNGDKASGRGQVAPFVSSGDYAGVSIGYRLSAEAQFPEQIYDCKAAIRWIRANAQKYGFDPERIGVFGRSAGAHLASLLGTSGGVKELEGTLGSHAAVSSRVACVVNYFGPQNLATMSGPRRSGGAGAVAALLGGNSQQMAAAAKAASPITYISRDDPPSLHIHGTQDPTVPYGQATEMDAALKKAGVPSLLVEVTGGGHGFGPSTEIDQRVKKFFDMHLRGIKSEISDAAVVAPQKNSRK